MKIVLRPAASIGSALSPGLAAALAVTCLATAAPAAAQQGPSDWSTGVVLDLPGAGNTTVIQRSQPAPGRGPEAAGAGAAPELRLSALLTADGQYIDSGIVWRVFRDAGTAGASGEDLVLVQTSRENRPKLQLDPGDYLVNAAFGRANLTRRISLKPGESLDEQFVLNAGGLRLAALIGSAKPPANTVSYDIFEGEGSHSGARRLVMGNARPDLIVRLNAGIYHIVSTYGDANAKVSTDVSVEAGKLTEITLAHAAAKVTLKLVSRPGGEALPSTQWTIATTDGDIVKRSVGALPSHILAPGTYQLKAVNRGRTFEHQFVVVDGQKAEVEVLME